MATIGLTVVTILLTFLAVQTKTVGGILKIGAFWTGYAVITAMFAGVL